MSKFINILVVLVVLFGLLTGCDEQQQNSTVDATATVDADTSEDADVAADADTASADADSNDTAAVDADVENDSTDAATGEDVDVSPDTAAFCPQSGDPADATEKIELADGPACFVPGSGEALMAKAIMNAPMDPGDHLGNHLKANFMPAVDCDKIHMPDYCFPYAVLYGKNYKPKWADMLGENKGKKFLVVKYPDSMEYPKPGKELVIVGCQDGSCDLLSKFSSGEHNIVTYKIGKKLLTISWYPDADTLNYVDAFVHE